MLARILMLLVCLASGALAGPWPQEPGKTFVSGTVRLIWPGDLSSAQPSSRYYTLYLEHGLTARLTLGLDLGHSVSGAGKSVVFLSRALPAPGDWRIAGEMGLGRIDGQRILRPGLSVGRPLETAAGWGWLSAEAVAEIGLDTGTTDVKLDLTYGRPLPRGRKLIVQMQTGRQQGDPFFARLAPSVVFPLSKDLKLETGASLGLTGESSLGVMFGLWRSF